MTCPKWPLVTACLLTLGFSAFPSDGRAQQGPPYTLDQLEVYLAAGLSPDLILSRAQRDCLAFRMDETANERLRNQGAKDAFLEVLRTVCYRGAQEEMLLPESGLSEPKQVEKPFIPLSAGAQVVLTSLAGGTLVGELLSNERDTLRIGTSSGVGHLSVPVDHVATADRLVGTKSRWREGALSGLSGGFAVGFLYGVFQTRDSEDCREYGVDSCSEVWFRVAGVSALSSAIFGGVLGLFEREDVWERVYVRADASGVEIGFASGAR